MTFDVAGPKTRRPVPRDKLLPPACWSRPSTALRCGNRPKRRITSRWRCACSLALSAQRSRSSFEQTDRTHPGPQSLGMFEAANRQTYVRPGPDCLSKPGRDHGAGDRARLRVGGKRVRRAAVHVARQLVEQDISASAPRGVSAQKSNRPARHRAMAAVKRSATGIEGGVFSNRFVAALRGIAGEPEFKNIGWFLGHRCRHAERALQHRTEWTASRPAGRGSGGGRRCRRRQ